MRINVLSLFDGMSCGQIALQRLGIEVDNYYASEIKPSAIKVTMANFPNTIQLGDVCKIKGCDLPKIDLLIGGSPCQDFSSANKEKLGLAGIKSGLFYEYLRLKNEVKPTYFLLENVTMDSESYEIISQLMGTYPVEINSERVSPQLRQRSYWTNIGTEDYDLLGNRYCAIRQPEDKGILLQDILDCGYTEREKCRCLLEGGSRPNTVESKICFRYLTNGLTTAIFKSRQHYEDCVKYFNENYKGKMAEEITDNPEVFKGIRYMNQRELERCQTVPEGYTDCLTRNEAASCLGDGWTIDVICHLLKPLIESL